ncbi:hypothetical protein SAMN05444484_102157 [Flavobacterium chilense]|uniref:Uncharacterized protein n=1 Tax=Flavobacterium chilense TaxID=946677 RepID=A0A1M7CHC3_9FLAO|nr:hypothetical protein SAMN05444484_102157 [Flavobacterium chilense]
MTDTTQKSHSIIEVAFLCYLKSLIYSVEGGVNSKLNISLGATSNALAILKIVLTVGFILTVSILAICERVISER